MSDRGLGLARNKHDAYLEAIASTSDQGNTGNTVDNDPDGLEGLRSLLNGWKEETPDKKLEEGQREAAKSAIYSMYTENAAAEDTTLVNRWTETLNILLTFAGLQSAIVTAFILALDPNLKQDPRDTTVDILRQILHQLDNSTAVPIGSSTAWITPASAVRASAWWYSSLACSLLSAFGALLSKQWVLNYQSNLPWVTTAEGKAELREARHQGMRTWQFFGVIESLPILLQLSLLFFAIGLAQYLHPTSSTLFYLVISFFTFGAVFYEFTLFCGTIFPSCPFKSPITTLLSRVGYKPLLFLGLVALTVLAEGAFVLGWLVLGRNKFLKEMVPAVSSIWREYTTVHLSYWYEKDHGEAVGVGENSTGAGGVLCWWLYQDARQAGNTSQLQADAAIDVILSFPPKVILDHFQTRDVFESWCRRVISDLFAHLPGTTGITTIQRPSTLQEVDALSHFMYHSPTATRIAISSVNDDNFDNRRQFCNAIRNTFPDPAGTPLLPIVTMRWTTVAVYLRAQLHEWCISPGTTDDKQYRHLITQELPVLLSDPRLLDHTSDLGNILSLAAITLVHDTPNVHDKAMLGGLSSSIEQIILALYRLSYYDHRAQPLTAANRNAAALQSPENLFPLIIRISRTVINRELQASGPSVLLSCPSWKHGRLGDMLVRFLGLGAFYRGREELQPGRRQSESGRGALIKELHSFMVTIFEHISSHLSLAPHANLAGLFPLSSPSGLSAVLNGYAKKSGVLAPNSDSLEVLHFTFGLRYYRPALPSRFGLRRSKQMVSIHLPNALPLSLLRDNPHILRQFMNDSQTLAPSSADAETTKLRRRRLLSVVIEGRDLFFPHDFRDDNKYEHLIRDLNLLADKKIRSKSFLCWTREMEITLNGFQRWDELLDALEDLRTFFATDQGAPNVRKESRLGVLSSPLRPLFAPLTRSTEKSV